MHGQAILSEQQRKVVILSGPSGVGKATLKKKVIELARSDPGLPTYATMPLLYSRQRRQGETDGEFLFVTEEEIRKYPATEVFRRPLYGRYWQAVRIADLMAAFAGNGIHILELPRLLAFDVMDCYAGVRAVLLSPVPIAGEWTKLLLRDAKAQLEERQRERANARGDLLSEADLRARIEEGISLLNAAHRYHRVLVMPNARRGDERDDVVAAVARQFIDFVSGVGPTTAS